MPSATGKKPNSFPVPLIFKDSILAAKMRITVIVPDIHYVPAGAGAAR